MSSMQSERFIEMAWADTGKRERELVLEVLESKIFALGPMRRRFESAFAAFCGAPFAVAVSSGTAGLHTAVLAAGIDVGDEVITSPFSFVASANAILYERATPVFVDVDPKSFVIDPDAIEAALTPRTKAILPVHIFGYPCDLARINAIADAYGLTVIEDACQAVGASRGGRVVGSWGNPAVFAFYPNKQMTTGEGGMITTPDAGLRAAYESLVNQGRAEGDEWLTHVRLGFNYRMDELSAALGLAQTERLPELLEARASVARRYDQLLRDVDGVETPWAGEPDVVRSWFVYVIRLDPQIDRAWFMRGLRECGIASRPYLPAIHLQPFYRSLGHAEGECPTAEAIAASTVALPFHARLDPGDQEWVAQSVSKLASQA
jgi:perosamine synthetase